MFNAATPQSIEVTRSSERNGAEADYTFKIRTTNALLSGDEIHLDFPTSIGLSNETTCAGESKNLNPNQICMVNTETNKVEIILKTSYSLRRMLSTYKIK